MNAREMLNTHPRQTSIDSSILANCIEACFECAQTCTACADACLGEDQVENLTRCIRLNLDCADLCEATGRMASRVTDLDTALLRRQIETVAAVAAACGDECEKHADMHEHCRVCMESCRRCEDRCRKLLGELKGLVEV